jgi:predicted nicotinamide N-methyase
MKMVTENPKVFKWDLAVKKNILLGREWYSVWMIDDVDSLIDGFISARTSDQSDLQEIRGCPFGGTLWPSTRGFVKWLESHPDPLAVFEKHTAEVLELGCGIGVISCYLAKLGFKSAIATDFEPELGVFVEKNSQEFLVQDKVHFRTLDWQIPLKNEQPQSYEIIVACDVLYDNEHIALLPKAAHALLAPNGVFYLADPERFRFEAAKLELDKYFNVVEIFEVQVPNKELNTQLGVINQSSEFTLVKILKCSVPKIT